MISLNNQQLKDTFFSVLIFNHTTIHSTTVVARTDIHPFIFFSHHWVFLLLAFFFCSSSPIQLYDLGSPAESTNTVPGCSLIDDHCTNMEQPSSCSKRGRCHSEWGSFSCLCEPGFTGLQCDQGKHIYLLFNRPWGFQGKSGEISVGFGILSLTKCTVQMGHVGNTVFQNVTLLQWEDNLALHKVLLQNSTPSLWYPLAFPTWQLN